ncbi:MAG: hypothetical protein IJU76_11710 [Desulfovibrionaceae bacterium]|nr:hypothetical protein [Desulfovibrionaceae bacterium]
MDETRRKFFKYGFIAAAAAITTLAPVKVVTNSGFSIKEQNILRVEESQAFATCGIGVNCSGGGGECGLNPGTCGGGGGRCAALLNCGGS